MGQTLPQEIETYLRFGLTPIPLKSRSKEPLVKWRNGWNPTAEELSRWASKPSINWGVRCGAELVVLDFDDPANYQEFIAKRPVPSEAPIVKTSRGYHIWLRSKRPVACQRLPGYEIKGAGGYVVAPPSVHANGTPYTFEVAPNGALPEVDLGELLGVGQIDSSPTHGSDESIRQAAPSDFALRYGKSPYPRSLCGLATKVLTRSDGKVKHLVSMRDWKWDCPKCAPLLKRHWLEKLTALPFRFILRLPTVAKPTAFLRRTGKPCYVHIVANGESWLFLLEGEAESTWAEVRRAGYELVVGDAAGDPTLEDVRECLERALCREDAPLNSRRKITHSRGLFKKGAQENGADESKRQADCEEGQDGMKIAFDKKPLTWESEVVMKPIEQVVRELEAEGWRILWQSEVEALAIKGEAPGVQDVDILQLIENLGVKLKRVGKEYMGLCPFHDDHKPSLSVNKERGLWHCFGCGKSGDVHKFVEEWQELRH